MGQPNKPTYGTCSLCPYVGSMRYHHIIPKRYRIKTNKKATLIWGNDDGTITIAKQSKRIEQLMIPVCSSCHKKLHPENWKYHINEKIVASKEGEKK